MTYIWIGSFFLSSSWIFLSPIFGKNLFFGIIFVFIGVLFNSYAFRIAEKNFPYGKKIWFSILILICCALYIPFPYNLPIAVFVMSFCLSSISFKSRLFVALEKGMLISGFILLLQIAALPFYLKIEPRLPNFNLLAQPVSYLLQLFSADSFFQNEFLYVQTSKYVYPFVNNSEKFGLYLLMNFFLSAFLIVFFFFKGSKLKAIFYLLFTFFGYSIFRYCALILAYGSYLNIDLFLNSYILILSFFPLAIISHKTLYFNDWNKINFNPIFFKNEFDLYKIKNIIFLFLGIILICFSFGFNDPGRIKKGRVLINERNSNWAWSYLPFDKNSFGQKAVYNYSSLLKYLKYFYSVDINFEVIKPDTLKDTDVLILKMPTEGLTSNEITAIFNYVEEGGGLFLIGDHTNVFGSSSYLNQISDSFGIQFNYDATYDLMTSNLSVFEASKILPHPIVSDVPRFLFGTSCTLNCSLYAEDVILGYQLRAVDLDYSQKNFFPLKIDNPNLRHGVFLQCCGIKIGKGRVLAFSDSTVFSNFWIFMPGKSELLIKSVDWLNRENIFPEWTISGMFILGSIFFSIGVFKYFNKAYNQFNLFFLITAIIPLIIVSIIFLKLFNKWIYQYPAPQMVLKKAYFDLEHSNILLPIESLVLSPENGYESFFLLTQRIGYVPQVIDKQSLGFSEKSTLFIINPIQKSTVLSYKEKSNELIEFIENGGTVILLDNRCNENSISNSILQPFNIKINEPLQNNSGFLDHLGRPFSVSHCAGKIVGGKAIIENIDKESILSIVKKGNGLVVVIGDSLIFSDKYLGNSMSIPNSNQKVIIDLAFWYLEELTSAPKKILIKEQNKLFKILQNSKE